MTRLFREEILARMRLAGLQNDRRRSPGMPVERISGPEKNDLRSA